MAKKREYKYSVRLSVSCVLTEKEKGLLMIGVTKVLSSVFGAEPVSGEMNINSEKKNK